MQILHVMLDDIHVVLLWYLQGDMTISYMTFTSQLSDDGDTFDCVLRHPRLSADLKVSDTLSGWSHTSLLASHDAWLCNP